MIKDETTIAAALYAQTELVLAALGFDDTTIDWGLPFEPPAKLGNPQDDPANVPRTIEVRHFRNAASGPFWTAGTVFQGIWQISVVDYTQKGPFPPLDICRQIAASFQKDAELWYGDTRVTITAPPSILSVIEEQHRATYPVSVPYRCAAL